LNNPSIGLDVGCGRSSLVTAFCRFSGTAFKASDEDLTRPFFKKKAVVFSYLIDSGTILSRYFVGKICDFK